MGWHQFSSSAHIYPNYTIHEQFRLFICLFIDGERVYLCSQLFLSHQLTQPSLIFFPPTASTHLHLFPFLYLFYLSIPPLNAHILCLLLQFPSISRYYPILFPFHPPNPHPFSLSVFRIVLINILGLDSCPFHTIIQVEEIPSWLQINLSSTHA